MRFSFDAWTPDLPSLGGGNDKAYNVLPASQSYRPVSGLVAYASNALTARCQGAAVYTDSAGNVNAFAGDATKLYRLTSGSTAWSDVSRAVGGAYATPGDGAWNYAIYNNRVAAFNFADDVQTFLMGTDSAFSALASGAAPKARYGCVAKNFLLLGNTNDGSDGNVPSRIWWSKQGDITSWPTPASSAALAALSGKVDLSGDFGWIMGMIAGLQGADIGVVCERGLFRGIFTADANIWTFDLVEGAKGTPAPGSLVQQGGILYYLGQDGFYAFNGVSAVPIGSEIVDKFFFSDATHGVDQSNMFRISSVADPINKIVMWGYPSVSGGAGNIDRVLCYNWAVNRWSLITGLGNLEIIARLYSLGYSLETLDTLSSSIDTLPFSLDSRQLTGGKLLIGAFATDHRLYTFSGTTLAATLTTTEQSHPTNQRVMLTEAWPIIEGTSVAPTITALTRNRQEDAATTGSAVAMNAVGFCPLRTNARFTSLQLDIPAGSTWTHAVAVDVPDEKIIVLGGR